MRSHLDTRAHKNPVQLGGLFVHDLFTSLFSMSSDNLRYLYASLTETNLSSALASAVKDFATKWTSRRSSGTAFQQRIEESVRRNRVLRDEEVLFRCLDELRSTLGIPAVNIVSRKDCVDICDRIVAESMKMYAKHHKGFTGTDTQTFLQSVAAEIAGGIGARVPDDPRLQDELVNKLDHLVKSLPQEQQNHIRRRIGVDDLSRSVLRKVIAQGSAGILFASVVEVAGFAAYQTAVTSLAYVAGLVGLTLPFTVYTTLTSLMAVVSNPLFLVALIGGELYHLNRKGGKELRERHIPMLVALALFSSDKTAETADDRLVVERATALVNYWQKRLREYTELDEDAERLSLAIKKESTALRVAEERLAAVKSDIWQQDVALDQIAGEIVRCLGTNIGLIVHLASSGPAQSEASRCWDTIERASSAMARYDDSKPRGLLSSFASAWDESAWETKARKALEETARALVDAMPTTVPRDLQDYSTLVGSIKADLAPKLQTRTKYEDHVRWLEGLLDNLRAEHTRLQRDLELKAREIPAVAEVAARLKGVGNVDA